MGKKQISWQQKLTEMCLNCSVCNFIAIVNNSKCFGMFWFIFSLNTDKNWAISQSQLFPDISAACGTVMYWHDNG